MSEIKFECNMVQGDSMSVEYTPGYSRVFFMTQTGEAKADIALSVKDAKRLRKWLKQYVKKCDD